MSTVNRRQFLQLASGATVMSVLSPSIARAAAIPANRRTGTLRDVEVAARHDEDGERIRLVLTNTGHTPVRLTVTDAYLPAHRASYHLQPGEHATHTTELHRSHGWYDLSVACDGDAPFLRRFAGHVETGRASASDPAVLTN